MLEGFTFTVSYALVAGINSLHITIETTSAEDLIIFVLDIYNTFHNTILPNPSEIVYLILKHIKLE